MKEMKRLGQTHRKLEGWPLVFTILVTISILIGGVVEFVPLVLVDSNIPTISSVRPFTPLELAGRDIYIREGCVSCHSQMVRPFRDELERYGDYGKPGEDVYERPFLWGSKRTGPDLQRVGGKYPDLWHVLHMQDPRSTSPRSLMPPYAWLLEKDTDVASLPRKLRALRALGTPYSDLDIENAESDALVQAREISARLEEAGGRTGLAEKEIIAVIAYLQSLGADLSAAAGNY